MFVERMGNGWSHSEHCWSLFTCGTPVPPQVRPLPGSVPTLMGGILRW